MAHLVGFITRKENHRAALNMIEVDLADQEQQAGVRLLRPLPEGE